MGEEEKVAACAARTYVFTRILDVSEFFIKTLQFIFLLFGPNGARSVLGPVKSIEREKKGTTSTDVSNTIKKSKRGRTLTLGNCRSRLRFRPLLGPFSKTTTRRRPSGLFATFPQTSSRCKRQTCTAPEKSQMQLQTKRDIIIADVNTNGVKSCATP